MLTIEISEFGPPSVLRGVERPIPEPKPDELVIRVRAAGVARADVQQRRGHYPPPPGASDIPGLDVAGVVHAVGAKANAFRIGDAVCAILSGGGYAEYCAVPEAQVLPVPGGWSFTEAASLPENMFTAYDNLITRGSLRSGETALIHGGGSGLGSTAIMLCRAWKATPIVTAGSDEKCSACLKLGAEHAINYKAADFAVEAKQLTGGRGVDVILDMVGGSYLARNLETLAMEGRLVIVAMQGGTTATLPIGELLSKRLRILGSTMRARDSAAKGSVTQGLLRDVWPLLPAKDPIRPVIDSTFPLRDASKAHERMEAGEHLGKIVLLTD